MGRRRWPRPDRTTWPFGWQSPSPHMPYDQDDFLLQDNAEAPAQSTERSIGGFGGHLRMNSGEHVASLVGTQLQIPINIEKDKPAQPAETLTPPDYRTQGGIEIYGSPVLAAMAMSAVKFAHEQALRQDQDTSLPP